MRVLPEKIKEARRLIGVSQEGLGELVGGVEKRTVGRWEQGSTSPSVATIERLAELAGRPVAWFFQDDGASVVAEPAPRPYEPPPAEPPPVEPVTQMTQIVATLTRMVETGQEQQSKMLAQQDKLLEQQDKLLARLEQAQAQLDKSLDFGAELARREDRIKVLERQLGPVSDPGSLAGKKLAR